MATEQILKEKETTKLTLTTNCGKCTETFQYDINEPYSWARNLVLCPSCKEKKRAEKREEWMKYSMENFAIPFLCNRDPKKNFLSHLLQHCTFNCSILSRYGREGKHEDFDEKHIDIYLYGLLIWYKSLMRKHVNTDYEHPPELNVWFLREAIRQAHDLPLV